MRRQVICAAAALILALAPAAGAAPATVADGTAGRSAALALALTSYSADSADSAAGGSRVERRRIGTSVRGRPIIAYRVGEPGASIAAVVLGSMHGDEPAGTRLARAIVRGAPVAGVDLWVVPTLNPDGLAAGVRQNARGVDLNRNWRHRWKREGGRYDSGPRPFSEPETRAMRRLLDRVDPRFVVSFHQPLRGVDSDGAKNRRLMRRLADGLGLPAKPIRCHDGVCHGTMTGWFNSRHRGACITVEFGYHPPRSYLTGRAARGTVHAVLGSY